MRIREAKRRRREREIKVCLDRVLEPWLSAEISFSLFLSALSLSLSLRSYSESFAEYHRIWYVCAACTTNISETCESFGSIILDWTVINPMKLWFNEFQDKHDHGNSNGNVCLSVYVAMCVHVCVCVCVLCSTINVNPFG